LISIFKHVDATAAGKRPKPIAYHIWQAATIAGAGQQRILNHDHFITYDYMADFRQSESTTSMEESSKLGVGLVYRQTCDNIIE
jgi:hypothetical protein